MTTCPQCPDDKHARHGDPILCRPCSDRLLEHVAALPALHIRLGERLIPKGRGGPTVSGTREVGIQLDQRIVQLRQQITTSVISWARIVTDERRVTPPLGRLATAATFLRKHHEWLMAQPYADEYADAIEEEWRRAQWLIVPPKARQFGGQCREPICDGQILVAPETDSAKCILCGSERTIADHWALVFGVVEDDWLGTATEISHLVGLRDGKWIPPATIRKWASRKRLTAHGERNGDPTYRLDEVLALANDTQEQAS